MDVVKLGFLLLFQYDSSFEFIEVDSLGLVYILTISHRFQEVLMFDSLKYENYV